MKSLKELLPNCSKSFLDANFTLTDGTTNHGDKNPVQPIVAPRRGKMNKVEAEYAMILQAMKQKGEILRYEFEGITLRFANVKYTPDFVVIIDSCHEDVHANHLFRIKFIEVKGPFIKGNRERAVERFRHAKTYWPEFTFELHQKSKEGWRQLI